VSNTARHAIREGGEQIQKIDKKLQVSSTIAQGVQEVEEALRATVARSEKSRV